ncbi:MAG: hypothetical protein GVY16_03110 [Planctomycetes bacterium]|jgi:nucleoside-diphosphate-sugar epimerase|nr:hypothetical protein [Planctomycetota bacterium]
MSDSYLIELDAVKPAEKQRRRVLVTGAAGRIGSCFAIVHGLSNNRFNRMSIVESRELLGYAPQDDFTEENPDLSELDLHEQGRPHSDRDQNKDTGLHDELE